jgi:hypothetical protein
MLMKDLFNVVRAVSNHLDMPLEPTAFPFKPVWFVTVSAYNSGSLFSAATISL